MKFKSVPLLAVTIAVTAMISAGCQAPNPPAQETPVSSAPAQNTEKPNTPTSSGRGSKGSMQGAGLPPGLKLTDEQKTQLKGIQENYRSKMETILSNEQKNQLKAAREQNKDPRAVMQSLNLTNDQMQQLKDLRQSQRQQIDKVLTDEQKQELQKMQQNWQPRPGSQDSSASQGQ
ncbi:MAG TPA: Spy/CpxP family protein refolding chaperone [Coleofasciculaceae cyanobacterium]|jgi:Spy/CpxP family protein refolding chaperone